MPPTPERSAYEVLGLDPAATKDEIKKRYRELARQYHPDVNQKNPSAAKIFNQVTQAYKTLSDDDSRKTYDAELRLRQQQAQRGAARSGGTTTPPRTSAPGTTTPPPRPSPAASEAARLTGEAQDAFSRGRLAEARDLAAQARRLNPRSAEALEVLGDIYHRQGRNEDAMAAYSMALQINPRNQRVMNLWERMARASGPSAQSTFFDNSGTARTPSGSHYDSAGRAARPAASSRPASTGRVSRMSGDKRPIALLLAGIIGYGFVFFAFLYTALYPGDAPRATSFVLLSMVSEWNATIWTTLALCGLVLGATMTITGVIRRIDDELILSGVSARGGSYLPLGLLMIVVSVLNFYVAAVLYAIVTYLQESLTASMMRVLGATVIIVGLLSVAYTPGHFQVFLWGGNVVFITFVIGWLLGDFFRSDI